MMLSIGLGETKGPLMEMVIDFARPSRDLAMSTPDILAPMINTAFERKMSKETHVPFTCLIFIIFWASELL